MIPIPIPEAAKLGRPERRQVNMGPPRGVSDEDCGTVEMLIAPTPAMPGFGGRAQYAYYRPSPEELEQLAGGAFIEIAQVGTVVQPFSANVWGAP